MRAPVSWVREFAALPADVDGRRLAEALVRAGLEVESVEVMGADVDGPVVVGRVVSVEELAEYKKPIRWCQVEVGAEHGHPDTPGIRGIICGARNFAAGDLVAIALPGTVLPGDFRIASRETYGHVSDGMICSARELGLGDEHDGIIVLPADAGVPGDDAKPLLGIGDEVLDIAVTPDRGYALSIRGIAREAATAFQVAFVDPGLELVDLPAPEPGSEPHPCASDDLAACDLFPLRTITGFDPHAPTPSWMSRRLVASGMRSVSLAVDVTNYVMLETGQPLHAFDLTKLRGPVRPRAAGAGETLETLDHASRALSADDLVISDDSGPIGIAGVMGGLTSEIDNESTSIVLEAAHFDPTTIARTCRRHKLSSEASRRFERGVDRVLAPYASARATALLLQLGGGRYLGMTAVEAAHEPTTVALPVSLPSVTAGLAVDAATVVGHLRAVGCAVDDASDPLVVAPPSWRPDLTDPADLVEEVLRLVGYDAIPSTLPTAPAGFGLTERQKARGRVGRALAGSGFVEVLSYPFVGDVELDALGLPTDDPRRAMLLLANPLSDEQPGMRTTLLPGLVTAGRRNIGRGTSDLALFEIGSVSHLAPGQEPRGTTTPPRPSVTHRPSADELAALNALLPTQRAHVAVLLCGLRDRAGWWGPGVPSGWSDSVEAVRTVVAAVNRELVVRPGNSPMPWHPGRCAELVVEGVVIGHAGELHPRVVEAVGLPARSSMAEVDLDSLIPLARAVVSGPHVGTFPVAKEDIALVVESSVLASDVESALRSGAGELLESLRLFDVYEGPQVGEGRKSLAFALRLRAPDRTLSVDDITAVREGALAAAAAAVGASLRA